MAKVNMTTDLDVAADELWNLIGGFNSQKDAYRLNFPCIML
jgi:hypothetical protein